MTAATDVRAVFEAARLSLDRAPVLQGVFERMAGTCAESLRKLCTPPYTFSFDGLKDGGTHELIKPFQDGCGGIYYSPDWDARILIGCDRDFVFSLVEAMFGADGTETPRNIDRAFSSIELRAVAEMLATAAATLQSLFAPIDRTSFKLDRIEEKLEISAVGLPDVPAIVAHLSGQVFSGGGRMFILIPNSALLPLRKRLQRERPSEAPHSDPGWARLLLGEVGRAEVVVSATMEGPTMTLHDIAQLEFGQILTLRATTETLIDLEGEGMPLFRCRLGQSKGMFTIAVEHPVDGQQEMLSDIVAGTEKL